MESGLQGNFILDASATCGGETSSAIVPRTEPSYVVRHRIYTRDAVTITGTFLVVCSNLLIAFSSVDVSLKRAFLLVFGRQSFSSRLTGAVDAATEVPP